MISVDASTLIVAWAAGGWFFLWVTTRRREVGLGYGWLLRGIYLTLAIGSLLTGFFLDVSNIALGATAVFIGSGLIAAGVSVVRRHAGVAGQRAEKRRRSARVAAMVGRDRIVERDQVVEHPVVKSASVTVVSERDLVERGKVVEHDGVVERDVGEGDSVERGKFVELDGVVERGKFVELDGVVERGKVVELDGVVERDVGEGGSVGGGSVVEGDSVERGRVVERDGVVRRGKVKVDTHSHSDSAEFPPWLDLLAALAGLAAAVFGTVATANGLAGLAIARILVGALFLGAVTDSMLLGHWYLVQPGLRRAPLLQLVKAAGVLWVPETIVMLWPTGMVSVLNGTIDDGYNGLLGWFWLACTVTTAGLVLVTRAVLNERQYSAVMAATGLIYLAILTAFGQDLVARILLAP